MKMIFTVVGARMFNDTVEGTKYDFTKLKVQMDMPESANAVGQDVVDMQWGTHENFAQLKSLTFPLQMELDVNPTTKGFEIKSAKPVAATPKVASVG